MENINFIVTPSNKKYTFICYELESKKIIPKFYKKNIKELENLGNIPNRPSFYAFGIAKDEKYIYVVSHTKIGYFDIQSYEYLGLVEGVVIGLNSHQLLIDNNDSNILYICNTSNDSLTVFNLKTKENKYVVLNDSIDNPFQILNEMKFKPDIYIEDNYHFNSICQHDDSLFLLLCYKGKQAAKIIEISSKDYQPLSIIEDVGFFNHDLISTSNHIYTISTQTGELVDYNRNNKIIEKYKICEKLDYFWIRGMKKINNSIYIFVGNKNDNVSTNFPAIIVYEFDINTKKIISTNMLPLSESILQVL